MVDELTRREVAIVQRRLTHYRVPLFERLRLDLQERNIRLRILHGTAHSSEISKNDAGHLDWAEFLPTHYFLGGRICWQDFIPQVRGSDLVIVTQENKLLHNHWSLVRPRKFRLSFWGHGANLQCHNPNRLRERFKRWTTNRVDWWFAYTDMSADLVACTGFPRSRITVVNNAVDTGQMRRWSQDISEDETRALRRSLGIEKAAIGAFVGSFHSDKRIDFLFTAAEAVRRAVPEFHLVIIGDGQEREVVRSRCQASSWMHWVGPRFGREKIAYLSTAHVMLNPGLVGLGILDSFACRVPLVTTDCGNHSPEIAYLSHGVNGIMTANDIQDYSAAVIKLLRNDTARMSLCAGCGQSAEQYTLENMVRRLSEGIIHCLETPTHER